MRRTAFALLLGACLAGAASGQPQRQFSQTFDIEPQQPVEIALRSGELAIEATESDRVRARVTAQCRKPSARCERRLDRIALAGRQRSGALLVEVLGVSKWRSRGIDVQMTLSVPAHHPLAVHMLVGDLDIRGVERDLTVDVGVGEVRLSVPRGAVQSVSLETGIGSAELYDSARHAGEQVAESRRQVDWAEGRGEANVLVDLGVGEISVRLVEAEPALGPRQLAAVQGSL